MRAEKLTERGVQEVCRTVVAANRGAAHTVDFRGDGVALAQNAVDHVADVDIDAVALFGVNDAGKRGFGALKALRRLPQKQTEREMLEITEIDEIFLVLFLPVDFLKAQYSARQRFGERTDRGDLGAARGIIGDE